MRICVICSTEYHPTGTYTRYCSDACRKAGRKVSEDHWKQVPENLAKLKAQKAKLTLARQAARDTDPIAKERHNQEVRQWMADNLERFKNRKLSMKYGITYEQFKKIIETQNNSCAICMRVFGTETREDLPCVDHCHKTNRVRGLLCRKCNRALGLFGDDPELLKRALRHLGRKVK